MDDRLKIYLVPLFIFTLMKILYVSKKYDYGKPELGLSYEYQHFYQGLLKMDGGSHEILFFPVDDMKLKGLDLDKEFSRFAFEERPQFILFSAGGISRELIRKASESKDIVTALDTADDHWMFYTINRYIAFDFNWVLTTDPLAIKKYHKIGYKNVIFTPQGCNPDFFKPLNLPKIYDVSFVGRPHGIRKKMINKLRRKGIKVACFGEGWPSGHISYNDFVKVISQSKINLNFSQSSGIWWKQLALLFVHRKDRKIRLNTPRQFFDNLQAFWPSLTAPQIKGRLFEIPCCGGFELTSYTLGLEGLYEIGKEIECFRNFKELVQKIRYYLEHEEEREAIAKAGYERTLRDHTWEKRFKSVFKKIGLM